MHRAAHGGHHGHYAAGFVINKFDDWSLTAKRYARWIPADMPDAGNKAVKMWAVGQHLVNSTL
jgi:hypothetical protein